MVSTIDFSKLWDKTVGLFRNRVFLSIYGGGGGQKAMVIVCVVLSISWSPFPNHFRSYPTSALAPGRGIILLFYKHSKEIVININFLLCKDWFSLCTRLDRILRYSQMCASSSLSSSSTGITGVYYHSWLPRLVLK